MGHVALELRLELGHELHSGALVGHELGRVTSFARLFVYAGLAWLPALPPVGIVGVLDGALRVLTDPAATSETPQKGRTRRLIRSQISQEKGVPLLASDIRVLNRLLTRRLV